MMYGHPDYSPMVERRNEEFKALKFYPDPNPEMLKVESNLEYDNLLNTSNIIVMDFMDASANNAVVECLSANIPFFL